VFGVSALTETVGALGRRDLEPCRRSRGRGRVGYGGGGGEGWGTGEAAGSGGLSPQETQDQERGYERRSVTRYLEASTHKRTREHFEPTINDRTVKKIRPTWIGSLAAFRCCFNNKETHNQL
jgi:hypothetical protein